MLITKMRESLLNRPNREVAIDPKKSEKKIVTLERTRVYVCC